jgi:hypothetical protein
VKAAVIDDSLSSYITDEEIDRRAIGGHERLAEQLNPEAVVEGVDSEQLLAAMDTDEIRAYLDGDHDSPLETQ